MRLRHDTLRSDESDAAVLGAIHDWITLGSAIGLKTNILTYALKFRDAMQHEIHIKGRTVYKSDAALFNVQQRLRLLLDPLLDTLPDRESVLSYRRGVSPQKALAAYAGAKALISVDIRKFYDNVRLPHIVKALCGVGFSEQGAKLVGRYNLVKRGDVHSLQQGSPASPVISNLVGYFYFDKPILAWLRHSYPDLKARYVRYCDNVELFLDEDEPEGFREAYKAAVREIAAAGRFRTHDWASIAQNHPKRNMRFLGVVLNCEAKIERKRFDNMRALLFNTALVGAERIGPRFCAEYACGAELEPEALMRVLKGHAAYVASVNAGQGRVCKKLIAAAEALTEAGAYETEASRARLLRLAKADIMRYRDDGEPIKRYVERVVEAFNGEA